MASAHALDVFVDARGAHDVAETVERLRAVRCDIAFDVARLTGALPASRERDTVIVAAGIHVPDGWLDRLAACARREPSVGTVSAFSNAGRLGGYPRFGIVNPLPAGTTLAALDQAFAHANAQQVVELPEAEPGCVYVTRTALNAAGPLEAEVEGLSAFCARVSEMGLRHVLCEALFVFESAIASGPPVDEWDAVRPARRRVDAWRLRHSQRPRVLMVTHDWGGGVERHVQDLARLLGHECEVLRLAPYDDGIVSLRWLRPSEDFEAWIAHADWDTMVALLASLGVERVHFHHVHRLPRAVLELPASLGVPYDVTLHDYYVVCPRYHLSPAEGSACDVDVAPCRRCLESGPAQWGLTLDGWRALFGRFLTAAARVIAPSYDVVARVRRYFPDLQVLRWPHPEWPQAMPLVYKVVLLGGVSALKGARLLEACVADAAARGLPLHFHVIGHVDRAMAVFPRGPLTVGGSYAEEDLAMRIALERPDAFLFLSQVPETYSYTLTAAMRTELPVVATRAGALVERLGGYAPSMLLPLEATPAQVNDALLAMVQPARRPMSRGAMA